MSTLNVSSSKRTISIKKEDFRALPDMSDVQYTICICETTLTVSDYEMNTIFKIVESFVNPEISDVKWTTR